jgi:hypothetical protein
MNPANKNRNMRPIGLARRGSRVDVSLVMSLVVSFVASFVVWVITVLLSVNDGNPDTRTALATSEVHQPKTMTFVMFVE